MVDSSSSSSYYCVEKCVVCEFEEAVAVLVVWLLCIHSSLLVLLAGTQILSLRRNREEQTLEYTSAEEA